jgi:ABC-type spermidine/putrescine transport system permease subunit II
MFVAGGENTIPRRRLMKALRQSVDPPTDAVSTRLIIASPGTVTFVSNAIESGEANAPAFEVR